MAPYTQIERDKGVGEEAKNMLIRRCETADQDGLLDVWLQATLHAHDQLPAAMWWPRQEALRRQLLDCQQIWVVEAARNSLWPVSKNCQQVPRVVPALVGFMAVEAQQLLALYVHPDYQQQGIGGCLLQLAKGYQSRLNVRVCALNIDAVQFYRRHGFHLLREVKDPLTGCDEVEMMYSKP